MKWIYAFIVGALFVSQSYAQDVSVGVDVTSGYIDRVFVSGETGNVAVQPSLNVGIGDLSLNAWANAFVQNRGTLGDADEIQVSAGYSIANPVNVSIGISQDFYFRGNEDTGKVAEIYAMTGLDLPLSPSVKVTYNFANPDTASMLADRWNYDFYGTVKLAKSYEELDISLSGGVSDANGEWGLHDITVGVSIDVVLGKVTLSPNAMYVYVDRDTQHVLAGIGVKF